mgnify:CR=1 FL=1
MAHPNILNRENAVFVIIDIQEAFRSPIPDFEEIAVNSSIMARGCQILGIPIIITEQYPKGLGNTCAEVEIPEGIQPIEKICFSCIQSANVLEELKARNITSLIVCGVESHICVLKTTLEALEKNIEVHVVADAVSSRTTANKQLALERMRQSGAFIVSTEIILFQLIDEAGTDAFKTISRLIK